LLAADKYNARGFAVQLSSLDFITVTEHPVEGEELDDED